MKYFKIDIIGIENNEVTGDANGENILNAMSYFDKISNGEILNDAPIFDYFFLESYDRKRPERWEWKLNDAHDFIRVYPAGIHWFISEKFKHVLDGFRMAKPFKFYASKLLYKGEKLDYYIMQIAGHFTENINLEKSVFFYAKRNESWNYVFYEPFTEKIIDKDDYLERNRNSRADLDLTIYPQKIVFDEPIDLIFLLGMNNQYLVSERLKLAIEAAGITGVEFSESDIEFEVLR